jgi:hypothetical protein
MILCFVLSSASEAVLEGGSLVTAAAVVSLSGLWRFDSLASPFGSRSCYTIITVTHAL